MRTVYLGTSEFAAAILRALAGSPHRPQLVVTRPDRPAGRGRKLTPPPVAVVARELGIDVDQPDAVNDDVARARIAAAMPDAVIVCAFGALIKDPLLSDHEILNVHPSLLPRWRGAAPIERAIMAGDEATGVAIMQLTAGLDSGPVCLMEPEQITAQDTFGSLSARLEALGARLLLRALDEQPAFTEQSEDDVTYAEKITAEDRTITAETDPVAAERTVRALAPHIGARLQLDDGSFLGVRSARVDDGVLVPLEVLPPGGKPMPYADYLRGRTIA